MDLGEEDAALIGLSQIPVADSAPPIPLEGLNEVLRAWSGKGQLWDALAMIPDEVTGRIWKRHDVERRAHRILYASLLPHLDSLPSALQVWLDGLPAESVGVRRVSSSPSSGVSWRETRVRFGWPPSGFVIKSKDRIADTLLVATLKWTAELLKCVRSNAIRVEGSLKDSAQVQMEALEALLKVPPLVDSQGEKPSSSDLRTLRREGFPWNVVSRIAQELLRLDAPIEELAASLLLPDAEARGRLFHLGVLGTVLACLRQRDAQAVSIRPLSGTSKGPSYQVVDAKGKRWDLWFEAGGIWSHYKVPSPYVQATSGLGTADSPLSPDIVILRPKERALIIECKYSPSSQYVGRDGLTQALAYATEMKTALAGFVESIAVGPEGVVTRPTRVETVSGHIGLASPSTIDECIGRFLFSG